MVTMAWNPPLQGTPEGYTVYRRSGKGAFELRQSLIATTLTYADTMVPVGRNCWHVTAFNSVMESAPSNQVCTTIAKPRRR